MVGLISGAAVVGEEWNFFSSVVSIPLDNDTLLSISSVWGRRRTPMSLRRVPSMAMDTSIAAVVSSRLSDALRKRADCEQHRLRQLHPPWAARAWLEPAFQLSSRGSVC
jgi:hypothetical protein